MCSVSCSQRIKMWSGLVVALLLLAVEACLGEPQRRRATDAQCVIVTDVTNKQQIKIEPYGADAVRVRAIPTGTSRFRDDLVSALVPPGDGMAASGPCRNVTWSAGQPPQGLVNGNLQAEVGSDGKLVFTRVGDKATLVKEKTVRKLAPTTTQPPLPGFQSLDLVFEASPAERIYGLGQHKTGKLDNKGVKGLRLNPANTEVLIPVVHSSLDYTLLFNLPSFGTVEYNDTGSYWHADVVLQADFWVATTHDTPPHKTSPWAQLQQAYVTATGHAPVYPEWSTGFWQCKNRYHNQSQVLDVVKGYQDRQLPISLIIIDYYNWMPLPLGDEVLPPQCWPDPKALVEELRRQGVELMISPYFHSLQFTSKYFEEAAAKGFIALDPSQNISQSRHGYADSYIYDLFQPEARAFAFNAIQNGYISSYGLHHWWLDCDEPCGSSELQSLVYNRGQWPAAFVGAAFPHMVDQMVWEGMHEAFGNDTVMLARSAWAGSQRFGGAVWSGDTHSDFENLNQQFRAGLNMAMSGIPYWTTDIGGYSGGDVDDPTFRQLVTRWFQWGAFCPIFRNHGSRRGGPSQEGGNADCGDSGSPNEIWFFGPEAEGAIAKVMRLRESLRPYVYAQYTEAAKTGAPVMRPLFYDFWNDEVAATVDDQLMFGPDYLVAPQLLQDATNRTVYLPKLPQGLVWQNIFTDVRHDTGAGGVHVVEPTPTFDGTFPVYRRTATLAFPPPPPFPECTADRLTVTRGADVLSHQGAVSEFYNVTSDRDCFNHCVADTTCNAWVRGPGNNNLPHIVTCYILRGITHTLKPSTERNFGCVRS
eukprot:m.209021 g.209021  ORF g.209021 m.209021 type:complete len:813 (-) comp18544_c0_seq3:63-2501(-)